MRHICSRVNECPECVACPHGKWHEPEEIKVSEKCSEGACRDLQKRVECLPDVDEVLLERTGGSITWRSAP